MFVINVCEAIVFALILMSVHRLAKANLLTVNNQSNIYSVVSQEKEVKTNHTLPLNKLKHIFDPANCSDGRTTCKTLNPENVSYYLTKEVNRNVERLCLIIRPATSFSEWRKRKINLDSLKLLTSLTWFQIMPQRENLITHSQVEIVFPGSQTQVLSLEELHITIPLKGTGLVGISPFVKSLKNLKVLNLRNTIKLNVLGQLADLISALEGKQLFALSLQSFQTMNYYHQNFIETWNTTNFLWPLQQCPLQYLDLSHNDIFTISPGIYYVAKNLRILDVSRNNLMEGNKVALFEYLMHPTLEIIYCNNQGNHNNFQNKVTTVNSISLKLEQTQDRDVFRPVLKTYENCMDRLGINGTQQKEKHYFCELIKCVVPKYSKNLPCAVLPSWSDIFPLNFTCRLYVKIPFAKHLKEINMANMNGLYNNKRTTEKNILCFGPNSVQKLIFSSNSKLVQGLYFQQEIRYTRISGFEQVTYIDLSDNELYVPLENEMFYSFPQLQYLYLSGNFMNISNSNICRSNKYLKVLDLRRNGLNTIADFKGCHYLNNWMSLKTSLPV